MTYSLGAKSRAKLQGVDPRLVAVVERAIQITAVDFMVVEGVRPPERQKQLYAQGRTVPGKVVTWTLKSKHIEGKAVDLLPAPYDWKDPAKFALVNKAMMQAAGELGAGVRWGRDWDGDGIIGEKGETDGPHWELT
ncbi:MAG: M15 family metallopeptidase [Phenylobacterium sp.]|uniref:M15 family metallopeptidase n=1 Tax=Phenylobacterium sp. TaxID=1871053 RepID=UPI0027230465|nr:M15 family metallopeptidase [Phenylobacterium sp.]MDO8912286.1 M15 family metallopeptidase [Phenylobacterium sp.]MDP3099498.1 M15 family metallopeptidase [Phenylobacterium sp.]